METKQWIVEIDGMEVMWYSRNERKMAIEGYKAAVETQTGHIELVDVISGKVVCSEDVGFLMAA